MRRLEMIVSRLAWFVPTMAGLVVIVFLISNVIPTDPVRVLLGENATPAQVEAMRVKLGYDQPLSVQLARHFRDIVTGNLGTSIYTQRPISEDLATRLPFKYGIATMTRAPQAFVRLQVEVDGRMASGVAADVLPPKWFTKDPQKPLDVEVDEMLAVIEHAVTCAVGVSAPTVFEAGTK